MEGGRADETRNPQTDRRVTAGLHRQIPQVRGARQRIARVRVVHQLRVEPRLLAQGGAVDAQGIELLAQGAGPAGEGGRFSHADWRFQSTGWRSRLPRCEGSQGRMQPSITRGWKHGRYFCKPPTTECSPTIGPYPRSGAGQRRRAARAIPDSQASGRPRRRHSDLRHRRYGRLSGALHERAHGVVGVPAAQRVFCLVDP
ncbi:hypothetical protein D3C80_1097200 [compost metagenome]